MRLTLALLLAIPGMLLLATPGLPIGLGLIWAAWWIYERSGLPSGDGLAAVLMTVAGVGALATYAQFVVEWLRTLP